MPMLLNIQNIYKNYGKEPMIVPVLKDVSLEVVQGDYIAIMGPSCNTYEYHWMFRSSKFGYVSI